MAKNVNPMNLINEIRKREQAQQAASSIPTNENIIKLKAGNNYAFRLLWLPPMEGFSRLYPMISQYVHRTFTKGVGESKVYCPTSPYLKGDTPEGYKCPICQEVFGLYKESATSASAKQIVDAFRRTMVGYIPVYVVQGPPEEKGKVRILQYTKSFHDFFFSKIFGIAPRKKKNDADSNPELENVDEPLNTEAFMYLDENDELVTTGYNFIVKVTTQKVPINGKMTDVNKYDMSFSHKETEVGGINTKVFKALNEKLKFDEDFYKESTNEELLAFKTKFLTNDPTDVEESEDDISSDIDNIVNKNASVKSKTAPKIIEDDEDQNDDIEVDEIPMGDVVKESKTKKTTKTVEVESIEEDVVLDEPVEDNSDESSDDGEENVDDFINNLLKGNK